MTTDQTETVAPEHVGTTQAARIMGVSVQSILRMETRGKIASTRNAAGHLRYLRADLEALATKREFVAAQEAVVPTVDDYVDTTQAARIVGVSVQTLRRMEARGKITATRTLGGHRRFRFSDAAALSKSNPEELDRMRTAMPEGYTVDPDTMTDVITADEAAEMLGVSRTTLRRWEREGRLVASRPLGENYVVYHKATIEALVSGSKA